MSNEQSGQIITFYSYKGGTGRTMALANTACLLARELSGSASKPNDTARVLAIDWDFEAPGLHRFFQPYLTAESQEAFAAKPGCIDLFVALERHKQEFKHDDVVGNRQRARALLAAMNFREYILDTRIPGLAFIKSGRFGPDYAEIVSSFNWEAFFHETIGLFAGFTDFLREQFAYVLIDSRTGVTDTSGICTMLLPDKLVTVFTPNRQSLSGLDELIHKTISYRRNSDDWRPLVVFPLPSRIEMARPQLFELWRKGGYDHRFGHSNRQISDRGMRDQQRLNRKINDLQRQWELLNEKLSKLNEQLILEPRSDENLRLRKSIDDTKTQRDQVEEQLNDMESQLAKVDSDAKKVAGRNDDQGRKGKKEQQQTDNSPWAGEDKGYQPLFEELFRELYELEKCDLTSYFDQVLLQHIPDYAYGEPIAVELEAGEERIFLRSAYKAFVERLIELPLPWRSLEDVRNERMISLQCDEALTKLQQGATDDTLRLGLVLLDKAATESVFDKFFDTLLKLGEAAFRTNPSLAQSIVSGAINHAERLLVQDPGALAEKMAEAAQLYYRCGQFAGAQDLWQRVLDIYRKDIGEEHPQTLAAMNGLAETLRAQGNCVKAQELHEQVLALRRKVLGEEHPDTLTSMNNLAETLRVQGDLGGARALQEQVLAVRHRMLGEEHPDTLTSMNNLATTLEAQGDLSGARALQEQVLTTLRRVLGEEHPNTLTSMNNLAATLQAQGDLGGARALFERVLEVSLRVLGKEHPHTLAAMSNLAEMLGGQGDLVGARQLQEQALELKRQVLGEKHPDTLATMNSLLETMKAQGDENAARELQERLLSLYQQAFGKARSETGSVSELQTLKR